MMVLFGMYLKYILYAGMLASEMCYCSEVRNVSSVITRNGVQRRET